MEAHMSDPRLNAPQNQWQQAAAVTVLSTIANDQGILDADAARLNMLRASFSPSQLTPR
jgi:hypothetical protein